MQKTFTVCALLYGDFPELAVRCLEPLFKLQRLGLCELRIGMNEVCKTTEQYVRENAGNALIFEARPGIYKYPMMRRMFYEIPITTDYMMWFDDDSFITEPDVAAFLSAVAAQVEGCDIMGSIYVASYAPSQRKWCQSQSWYQGKPISEQIKFVVGGWQCIKTDVLKCFNWPIPELKHCGGDVTLGVLAEQNGLVLKHYNTGVAINADETGQETTAPRRGGSEVEVPIGFWGEIWSSPRLLMRYIRLRVIYFLEKLIGLK